ncbi:bacterial transcriptional activator domain-containing protein [Lacrimispora saccharolytica]|nr:bacterial transcriptional activator domain-containing protein [Lacrimispora saccharolytica]
MAEEKKKTEDAGKLSPDNVLTAKMLGGFSLQYQNREIVLDRNTLSKTTQLLQILLLAGKEGVAKTSLIDALYGRDDSVENKNGSLNNTIFRMRKQLKAAGLPESNFVVIKSGMCYWDERIPVSVDALEFSEKARQARLADTLEEQLRDCVAACRMYTGEFLPSMIGEDWVSVRNAACREQYFYCMNEACRELMSRERYEELVELAHAAAEIYPFEEWQEWEIDGLIALARFKEAMEVYERTTKKTLDELGLAPSPEMLKRFRIMGERMSQAAGAIDDIRHRLVEKEKKRGAYFCTFPSFVDIYHVFSRIMERKGISVFIMLCTLKNQKNQVCGDEMGKDREASYQLSEAIRISLRSGDFYTRYNYSQYLIMLSEIQQENCSIVSHRIDQNFQKMEETTGYYIDFYVASIAEICKEEKPKPEKKFKEKKNMWK